VALDGMASELERDTCRLSQPVPVGAAVVEDLHDG